MCTSFSFGDHLRPVIISVNTAPPPSFQGCIGIPKEHGESHVEKYFEEFVTLSFHQMISDLLWSGSSTNVSKLPLFNFKARILFISKCL